MNYEIVTTDIFDKWLSKLRDRTALSEISRSKTITQKLGANL